MHLDPVELVMHLEEGFGITIPDSDAEQITSLGELHSYILYKKGMRQLDFCPSSRVFYRLRHALMEQSATGRHSITPAARVDNLVPRARRRQHWLRLGDALGGWRMPQLRRPDWVLLLFALPVIATFLTILLLGLLAWPKQPQVPPGAVVLIVAAVFVSLGVFVIVRRLTEPLAVELPEGCLNVRGLVTNLLRWNFAHLLPTAPGGVPCDETWEKLCGVFGAWSGIDPARLTPGLRFTDDFDALRLPKREEEL